MKYSQVECPKCLKLRTTLYRPSFTHPGPDLCYWCNKKRVKAEKENEK